MQLSSIDHVSVLITDVERSRHFYRDLLGLREIAKPRTFTQTILWFDLGVQKLHLLHREKADSLSPRHFALRVPSTSAARVHCQQCNIAIEEATLIPGADRFFIYDPDGNRIEIICWLEEYDPAVHGAAELDRA
jgi:glyoxylase I family protein